MTKRTAVAVACNLDSINGVTPVTGLLETYPEALLAGGGMPFIVPASADEALLDAYLDMAGGLFVPGGIDVDPLLYGQGACDKNKNILRLFYGVRRRAEYAYLPGMYGPAGIASGA